MKVSILQENIQWALGIVRNALPTKALRPITENIMLQTEFGKLILTATDLEMAITVKIAAKVEEVGELTVPSKLFINCIEALPQDRIDLFTKPTTKSLYVECGKNKSRIAYIPTDDYPLIPEVEGKMLEFSSGNLTKIISHTLLSAATEDSRPIFTGISIRSNAMGLTFASADGFRLSSYSYPGTDSIEAIIPAKALSALSKILVDPVEMVNVCIGESRTLFKTKNTEIMTQLLNGKFPAYESLIPTTFKAKAIVSGNDLFRSTKSAMIFSSDGGGIVKIKMIPSKGSNPGQIITQGESSEIGENEGILDCEVTGEEVKFAVKGKYFTEILSIFKENKISLEVSGPDKPIMIKNIDNKDFIHIIMPMSVNW